MFWKGILTGGEMKPLTIRGGAPFGAASAFAEAMEGLGKNIVRTEDPSHTTGGKGPKKQKKRPFPFDKGRTLSFSIRKTDGRSAENTVDTDKKVQ